MLDYILIYLAIGFAFVSISGVIGVINGGVIDPIKATFGILLWPMSALMVVVGVVMLLTAFLLDGVSWILRRFGR